MKVWIVSVLLCAAIALQTTEGAVVTEPEQSEYPVETLEAETAVEALPVEEEVGELSAEELVGADRSLLCPPGWIRYGLRCFQLVRTTSSWLNAERYCVNYQGSLASIWSPQEYSFLQNLLTFAGISTAWIGAYNFQNTWLWIDRAGFYYTNWQSLSSVSSYACAYMSSTNGWANTNCANGYAFFCSMTPNTC